MFLKWNQSLYFVQEYSSIVIENIVEANLESQYIINTSHAKCLMQ
jgi:hypothetical protein